MKSSDYIKAGIREIKNDYHYQASYEPPRGVNIYKINGKEVKIYYDDELDYMKYIKSGKTITDEGNEFVNGFKIVKTKNCQALYVKEENNLIIPYIFDIATNFNEYGLAMVAKDNKVSWINKDFKYITKDGTTTDIPTIGKFNGWDSITCFSEGELKVSKCVTNGINAFMDTDMKLKEFYNYNNPKEKPDKWFGLETKEFNSEGYAVAQNGKKDIKLLLSNGYYIDGKKLVENFILEKGLLEECITDAIEFGALNKIKKELDEKIYQKTR